MNRKFSFLFVLAVMKCSALFAQSPSAASSTAINLYVSRQTGQYTTYAGSDSKTTDKYESGNVSISTSGPILYHLDPADMSIGPNQSKTWNGLVWADPATAPEPGSSAPATLTGNYNVTFSRPAGSGSGGTIVRTYKCNDGIDDGCSFHGPAGGLHEIVNQIGTKVFNFMVHSLNVTAADSVGTCPNVPKQLFAEGYPQGGTYKWTSAGNVTITAGANTQTPTINCNAAGVGSAKVVYSFNGVTFSKTIQVKCKAPAISLSVPDSMFVGLNERFSITPTLTPVTGMVTWSVTPGLTLNSGPNNFVAFLTAMTGGWQTVTVQATICNQVVSKVVRVYVIPCVIRAPDTVVALINTNVTITASCNEVGNFSWTTGGGVALQFGVNQAAVTVRGQQLGLGWAEVNFSNAVCNINKRVIVKVISKPIVRIWAPFGLPPRICKGDIRMINADGIPEGGTYAWTLSSNSLKWVGAAGNTRDVVVEAARGGACAITCSYTVHGQTASASLNVWVNEFTKVTVTPSVSGDVNDGTQVTYTAQVFDHTGALANPTPTLTWKVVYIPIGQAQNAGNWVAIDLQGGGTTQTYTWGFPQGNFPLPVNPPFRMRAWIEASEHCTYRTGSVHMNVIRKRRP